MLKYKADPAVAETDRRRVFAVNQDRAVVAVGDFDSRDNAQEGGLTRAGRSEQRDQLTGLDFEAHVLERREIAKGFTDVADFNTHIRPRPTLARESREPRTLQLATSNR